MRLPVSTSSGRPQPYRWNKDSVPTIVDQTVLTALIGSMARCTRRGCLLEVITWQCHWDIPQHPPCTVLEVAHRIPATPRDPDGWWAVTYPTFFRTFFIRDEDNDDHLLEIVHWLKYEHRIKRRW